MIRTLLLVSSFQCNNNQYAFENQFHEIFPVRLTSNRRRWTHIFPKNNEGQHNQQHTQPSNDTLNEVFNQISSSMVRKDPQTSNNDWNNDDPVWSATQQTGVDWKSLTIPASLPITTDYFPDPLSLEKSYRLVHYDLTPQDIIDDVINERSPLLKNSDVPNNEDILSELVSQRLAQGFQLILLTPQQEEAIAIATTPTSSKLNINSPNTPAASSRSLASKLIRRRGR